MRSWKDHVILKRKRKWIKKYNTLLRPFEDLVCIYIWVPKYPLSFNTKLGFRNLDNKMFSHKITYFTRWSILSRRCFDGKRPQNLLIIFILWKHILSKRCKMLFYFSMIFFAWIYSLWHRTDIVFKKTLFWWKI